MDVALAASPHFLVCGQLPACDACTQRAKIITENERLLYGSFISVRGMYAIDTVFDTPRKNHPFLCAVVPLQMPPLRSGRCRSGGDLTKKASEKVVPLISDSVLAPVAIAIIRVVLNA